MHKEIYETAKDNLIENIGELVSAGDVYFDRITGWTGFQDNNISC